MQHQKISLGCRLLGHNWNGCKCSRCGASRDEGHDWQGCKCSCCGAYRDEEHEWLGCKCKICGKTRDEDHLWKGISCHACMKKNPSKYCGRISCLHLSLLEIDTDCLQRCSRCGEFRKTDHSMVKAANQCYQECQSCGFKTPPQHVWDGCTCSVCGEHRDTEHDWVKDGCLETCRICGKQQKNDDHLWVRIDACKERCQSCGKERETHEYHLVHHDVKFGSKTCTYVNVSDDYVCIFCRTPDACLQYPRTDTYYYKCARCGSEKTSDRLLEGTIGNVYINDLPEEQDQNGNQ